MRRIIMFNRVSADGYFAAADGNLNWTIPEPELDQMAARASQGVGTLLFGRKTYQMFERFWPTAVDQDPHHAGRQSPELHAMGVWINAAAKWVFSTTLQKVTWQNSHLRHEIDRREIESLKQQPGSDILIFGSGSLVSQLTERGLIDEYHFVVGPLLLGGGRPVISGVPNIAQLRLLEAKPFPQGNVMLRYARKG